MDQPLHPYGNGEESICTSSPSSFSSTQPAIHEDASSCVDYKGHQAWNLLSVSKLKYTLTKLTKQLPWTIQKPSKQASRKENQLQDINQSGFKPAHSTETALIAVTERLHAARSAQLSSVLILLDLSAAYDTVNHKILLSVLTDLGITGTAWKWSYLEDRHYQVNKILSTCPLIDRCPAEQPERAERSREEGLPVPGNMERAHVCSTQPLYRCPSLMFSFPSSDTQVSALTLVRAASELMTYIPCSPQDAQYQQSPLYPTVITSLDQCDAILQLLESSNLTTFPLDPIHTAPVSLPGPATLHLLPYEWFPVIRVNHKILLSVLTDLGITATAWNPGKTELLFVPSTATEDVSALTLVRAASELM
ncbi:hypothetical protein NFI96_004582, partial [Prochilodus magdalenae]